MLFAACGIKKNPTLCRYGDYMNYRHTRFCENTDEIIFDGVGRYDIPEIYPEIFLPCEFVGFNYAKGAKDRKEKGVHFFVDDYQFDRVWRDWKRYGDMLSEFGAVMTPDFSTYTDYPKALQIYNHYRKHFIGAYLQTLGVKVYPTISWSDKSSFEWCFDGEPVGGTVCVSSVGTQQDKKTKKLFLDGYNEMIDKLNPETIIFYGQVPKECMGNIVKIKAFQEKFREAKCDGR